MFETVLTGLYLQDIDRESSYGLCVASSECPWSVQNGQCEHKGRVADGLTDSPFVREAREARESLAPPQWCQIDQSTLSLLFIGSEHQNEHLQYKPH